MFDYLKRLYCSHRHNIQDHPYCFASGNVNPEQVKELEEETKKPWYQLDGLRIGYLDIESDGLKADFGTMLSWCIKEKGGDVLHDYVEKTELFEGERDQRIVESLIETLNTFNIIVTYYGTGFDLPFARSKALYYNLDFPPYQSMYHFDLFYPVKSKLLLSRNSLDSVCDYLGIEGKTPLKKETWRKAKYGDPEAIKEVLEHNIGDVVILEELHDRIAPFQKWCKKSI